MHHSLNWRIRVSTSSCSNVDLEVYILFGLAGSEGHLYNAAQYNTSQIAHRHWANVGQGRHGHRRPSTLAQRWSINVGPTLVHQRWPNVGPSTLAQRWRESGLQTDIDIVTFTFVTKQLWKSCEFSHLFFNITAASKYYKGHYYVSGVL